MMGMRKMQGKMMGVLLAGLLFATTLTGCGAGSAAETVSFTASDLDGNTYSSADVFKDHTVTMVNIWGTFCDPCKEEMPDLATLSKDFEAKGYGLVGIICDGNESADAAKKIIEENGVEYLNLVTNEEIEEQLPTSTFPCTYFVDSNGNVVGKKILGSSADNIKKYTEAIEEAAADVK